MLESQHTTTEIENQNSKIENPTTPASSFLPVGHLSLLLGDPGVGKSLVALDFAARITTNSLPPPHPSAPRRAFTLDQIPPYADPHDYRPAHILALSLEDDHYTIIPRLLQAGADRDFLRIPKHRLSLVPEKPQRQVVPRGAYRPPAEIPISSVINCINYNREIPYNLKLVILDPLPAFLGTADSSSAGLIRTLLDPLFLLAQHHNLAILGISHLNKSTHKKTLLHRSLGSQAYPALARTVYLLTRDNTPLTTGHCPLTTLHSRRLLLPIKSNLTPGNRALAFQITPSATLDWEKSPITDHPLLHSAISTQSSPLQDPFTKSQLEFAIDFVKQTLDSGPVPSNTLLKEARSLGISTRTYHRARFHLQVACHRDAQNHQWLSYLPNP